MSVVRPVSGLQMGSGCWCLYSWWHTATTAGAWPSGHLCAVLCVQTDTLPLHRATYQSSHYSRPSIIYIPCSQAAPVPTLANRLLPHRISPSAWPSSQSGGARGGAPWSLVLLTPLWHGDFHPAIIDNTSSQHSTARYKIASWWPRCPNEWQKDACKLNWNMSQSRLHLNLHQIRVKYA